MRTKTLLLTAAVTAAGIASSMAQSVFSVNAVGYVNVTAQPGFQLIANPLNASPDNTVATIFTGTLPDGTTLYKFNPTTAQYSINSFNFGAWDTPSQTLNPGEGAFFLNPGKTALTLTFVGEVPQGALSQAIPKGFSIQASQVPQAGKISTDLKFPAAEGDVVYTFNAATQAYAISSFTFGAWDNEPSLDVGQSMFVNKAAATAWARNFSVNQ